MEIWRQIVIKTGSWYFYDIGFPDYTPIIVIVLLTGFYLKRNPKLFWQPFIVIATPLLFWIVLIMNCIGPQSMAHLFELPVIFIISTLVAIARIFLHQKIKDKKLEIFFVLIALLFITYSIRVFTPFIPE